MVTLLEKRKKFILQVVLLQVLIAIPVLYMTSDRLFMYLNIRWNAVLPIDSRAANFTYHGIDLMKLVSTSQLTHNVNVTFAKGPKMVRSDVTFDNASKT